MTVATPLLGNFFGVMSGLLLGIRVSNLKSVALAVLELLAFNSHDRPQRTHKHTHKQTHIERTHYLRHSLRSLGGDNNNDRLHTWLVQTKFNMGTLDLDNHYLSFRQLIDRST